VLYLESPVPHTLDPRGLPTLAEWLQATLAQAGAEPAGAGS
jgi:hypothetical protein